MANTAIGMMDKGFFVGRKEVVDWINDTLKLNFVKVEQTASGAAACQLLDAIFPGKVPLHKVNWDAKQDYEFINNYKVLQNCFSKLKIEKNIEVEKLIRAKYQDNLEFMQWFKRFYELNRPPTDYDAVAERLARGGANAPGAATGRGGEVLNGAAKNTPAKPRTAVSVGKKAPRPRSVDDKENTGKSEPVRQPTRQEAAKKPVPGATGDGMQERVDSLSQQNTQLLATVEGLEKERDFYFEKLTMVEELLQEIQSEGAQGETAELIEKVLKILYATSGAGEQASEA